MTPDGYFVDFETEARQLAEEAYRRSGSYVTDAIDWACSATLPAPVIDAICDAYDDSNKFATVIDDALDGEVMW